jgi:predicted GNAT family acetyltransferase
MNSGATTTTMTTPNIHHDSDRKRFVLTVDGTEAELNYREVDAKTLDYYRTFVPSTLRGGGIASKLTEHALRHAQARGLKIIPTCPFIVTFIERHPEFASLVA